MTKKTKLILAVVFLVGADQLTKKLAFVYLPGVFLNPQGLLSLFPNNSLNLFIHWLLIGLFFFAWRFAKKDFLENLLFCLIAAGGISNGIDKLLRGGVVDFIDLQIWPVFNLADAMISLGVGTYLFQQFKNNN